MKRKIAFIVQRYGDEVNGGAEQHCRNLAQKLALENDVEVLTTCAIDYISWGNHYPEGETEINGLKIRRFRTVNPRNIKEDKRYRKFLRPRLYLLNHFKLYHLALSFIDKYRYSDKWVEAQGPFCKDLINYLESNHQQYDVLIFMTYLYYPTVVGLRIAPSKSILIPTAHDEKPIYYSIFKRVFQLPAFIMYNMEVERKFVNRLFDNYNIPSDIAGVGIEISESGSDFRNEFSISGEYILYVGRVDSNKGVNELFKLFLKYKKQYNNDLKLLIIGKSYVRIPLHPDIEYLGFVSDEIKIQAMKEALLLVLPSRFESLSMVVLESLALHTPVLVNGACEVLVEHCKKSHAGFYYNSAEEFYSSIKFALEHKDELKQMGLAGAEYVNENYQWSVILNKFERAFEVLKQL